MTIDEALQLTNARVVEELEGLLLYRYTLLITPLFIIQRRHLSQGFHRLQLRI